MSTIQTLRNELASRRGDWRALCDATGLSYWWLIKFAQGRIREPGLSKIEALQRFIDANPLPANTDGQGEPVAPAERVA